MTTPADIEAMIARVSRGDRQAFAALYAATSPKLFGICLRVVGDRGGAEDALQEVFADIWHNTGRYQVNGLSPMTGLITIARNRAVDRRRARRCTSAVLDEVAELADLSPGPEVQAMAASERSRIADCLGLLDSDRAEAVRRAYVDGDNHADLAARFGVPLDTIRTWLRRSLLRLRACLSS